MSEVKGSLLLEVARLIRANKDRDWTKYLTERDLEIVHSQILPSSWYPLDTYERAELAIFKEIGREKLENARTWGRFAMDDMIKTVYQNLVEEQEPMQTLQRFALFRRQLFKFPDPAFQTIEFKDLGPNHSQVIIRLGHPLKEFEVYSYQSMGMFERLVELAGGKEVRVVTVDHNWDLPIPYAVLDLSWK